jgi:uncharacterized membrane protein (DUF2068 family)
VRLLVGYKLGKGALQLLVAALFVMLAASGLDEPLNQWARVVMWHSSTALSVYFARLIAAGTDGHGLQLAALALASDGVLALVEGWVLARGRWWAPWLVAASMSIFVPFELLALVRRVRPFRALVLALNLAIVAWLAGEAWRETTTVHRARSGVR